MKMKIIYSAILIAAMLLCACSSVEDSGEVDAIPAAGDNMISSPTEASQEPEVTVSEEQSRPAETWAETDELPLETTENTLRQGEITDIELTYYEIWLDEGDSSMPIVTMYPEDAPDKSEIWSSSDESVAEVDDIGNITAVSSGKCVIKVQSAVCPEVYAKVVVFVGDYEEASQDDRITGIELTYYEIELDAGDSSMPYVTMYPEDASDKSEIWTSSDEKVAVVDGKGNITAVSDGECIIKVQSEVCPEVFAEVKVRVNGSGEKDSKDEINYIELSYYNVTLDVGDSSMPYVTMYPEDASDKSEIWTSSDEKVAVVDGKGNITAVSKGECTIRVQSEVCPDVYAEVSVTVTSDENEPEQSRSDSDISANYIDGILVVNKSYPLPADYNPGVDPDAQAAFNKMKAAAAKEGLNIFISSGFRSYEYQAELYERYVAQSGKAEADRYSARAGYSEHQTGLAFDLNSIDSSFADTEEYQWLRRHCYEYGFIIRYPQNGESATGYMYEPWHIRYLGVETAKKVYNSGLTLEEFLGIDSKYDL